MALWSHICWMPTWHSTIHTYRTVFSVLFCGARYQQGVLSWPGSCLCVDEMTGYCRAEEGSEGHSSSLTTFTLQCSTDVCMGDQTLGLLLVEIYNTVCPMSLLYANKDTLLESVYILINSLLFRKWFRIRAGLPLKWVSDCCGSEGVCCSDTLTGELNRECIIWSRHALQLRMASLHGLNIWATGSWHELKRKKKREKNDIVLPLSDHLLFMLNPFGGSDF